MKTIEIKLYKFSELSDEAKEKAINDWLSNGIDSQWYESIYEDAKNAGLEINSLDIDRASYCKGEFINSAEETAKLILSSHGEMCETFKTAQNFLSEYLPKKEAFENGNDGFYYKDETDGDEICEDFLNSLLEDYRIILSNEYDYQTSAEQISECLISNDYDFTENGEMY